jgi:hypothetical protein
MRRRANATLTLAAIAILLGGAFGKNRDPKDYPEKAKVTSFKRQPCARQVGAITMVCHVIVFEVEEQTLTGSCSHCDPLLPGQTYPARLDRKDLVLYVIHQKSDGTWGQDNYTVTELTSDHSDSDKH